MRLFVAVRPPEEALRHLASVLPRWPSAPERWHLTLAFLGEVDDHRVLGRPLRAACEAGAPLELQLAGSGTFGRGGPVWVGVAGDTAGLADLAGRVAEACRDAGADVERRPYRPHLTVGRRGHPSPALLAGYRGTTWTAVEAELVHSVLGRSVEHRVLERYPLGASPG